MTICWSLPYSSVNEEPGNIQAIHLKSNYFIFKTALGKIFIWITRAKSYTFFLSQPLVIYTTQIKLKLRSNNITLYRRNTRGLKFSACSLLLLPLEHIQIQCDRLCLAFHVTEVLGIFAWTHILRQSYFLCLDELIHFKSDVFLVQVPVDLYKLNQNKAIDLDNQLFKTFLCSSRVE